MDKKIGEEVDVFVGNKKLFTGAVGTVNNHKAVKITNRFDSEE